MGLSQSLTIETQTWREQDWQPIQRQIINFGKTRTLQSIKNGAVVDEYQVIWQNQSQFQFYLKSFNWRSKGKNSSHIVGSVGIKTIIGGGMCGGKIMANVYLQHMGIRLSQIDQIPLTDSILILLTALQGFHELFNHSGYFRVEQQQICIERTGRVKVWVNKDLSKNYPDYDSQNQCLRRNQTHMVRQLVDIIQSNTDREQILQPALSDYLTQLRRKQGREIGFEYAQVAVLQYAKMNNLIIPNRLDAATELYNYNSSPSKGQTSHFQPSLIVQKPHNLNNSTSQRRNDQLMMSHQSMPNLHNQGQQNSHFSKPQPFPPPNIRSQISYPASALVNTQTSNIEYTNLTQESKEEFIPQNSVNMMHNQTGSVSIIPSEIQIPSITKRTAHTQSQLACLQEASTNSIRIDQRDDRNTMKSMPLRDPFSSVGDVMTTFQKIRYSQCLQDDRNNHFNSVKINHDAFGLMSQPRRFMKQSSNSSYKMASSNSSRSRKWNGQSRRGSSPSRRESNQSRRQSFLSVKEEITESRRYFTSLGQYGFLDPQIEADMLRYLG